MRPGDMRQPWGVPELERFVRRLREPRAELTRLADQLRDAGWTDTALEPLELANTQLGQVQELLLLTARDLRDQSLEPRGPEGGP